jgi:hypothetical protein
MQDRFFAFHDQGMTSIMPALKAQNGGDRFGEQINNLALTFITPKGSDHQ